MPPAPTLDQLAAATVAAENSTPPEVAEALDPTFPEVYGYTLRPLTMGHVAVLEAINSPLVAAQATKAGARDIAAALAIISRPSAESDKLRRLGKLDDAIAAAADAVPIHAVAEVEAAIAEHIERAFAGALPMRAPGDKSPEKKMGDLAGNSPS